MATIAQPNGSIEVQLDSPANTSTQVTETTIIVNSGYVDSSKVLIINQPQPKLT